ncbi:MAG: hypothetical protein K0M40_02495 [Prolixibacteraceae bacterium]|nr:hypothetical protein [Prolixibacteraceae bacterium]
MHYLTILLVVVLITAFAVLSYLELKKLKRKVVQILEGKLDNKQLSKLINRARTSSKNQFQTFMFFQVLKFCVITTLLFVPIDLLISSNEFDITKYLIFFLFMIVAFSLNGIARANTIWNLSI